jgi:hypothetical protein
VKDEEKKKSAEGFMAILKGEPKENEGDSDEEEAPGPTTSSRRRRRRSPTSWAWRKGSARASLSC